MDDIKVVNAPAQSSDKDLENRDDSTLTDSSAPDDVEAEINMSDDKHKPEHSSSTRKSWKDRINLKWPPTKRQWTVMGVVLVIILGVVAYLLTHHSPKPVKISLPAVVKVRPPVPTTVASTLSGLPVDPSVNLRPVTGVMIENSTFARPQSGLGQAEVVFEAIAEGGITRFLALYQDTAPSSVGPIRSARPYYVQWDLGFDAAYSHVGGSPEALADITTWGAKDLNQFYNGSYYQRISSRAAPHNVYTSVAKLNQLEASKGFNHSNFSGFVRKKESPAKQTTASSINIAISGPTYDVHYDYVKAINSYNRSEAGAPHIDANTNTQISPKVVIAMVMQYSLEADGYHSDYNVIGSGPVYVFQDGTVQTGQWTKSGNASQITFTDSTGKAIALNPGQTWLTAVGSTSDVNYTP